MPILMLSAAQLGTTKGDATCAMPTATVAFRMVRRSSFCGICSFFIHFLPYAALRPFYWKFIEGTRACRSSEVERNLTVACLASAMLVCLANWAQGRQRIVAFVRLGH